MSWQEDAKIGDDWQRKGDKGWESNLRSTAVAAALRDAVRLPEEEGIASLRDGGLAHQLERLIALGPAASDDNKDEIDLALVSGRPDLARQLLTQSQPADLPVWVEYAKAVSALVDGREYRAPANLKVTGWLATFVPYLHLAETLSAGGDPGAQLKAVDAAFEKRNRSKNMFDPGGVDGDGQLPVTWDLRKRALLAAARSTK